MDILFKEEDFVFSYRVGGVLIHDDKVLLQRPKNDDYAIIGGHVASMETTIPQDGIFHGYDDLDHERIDLDFCWISLEKLKNGVKVYPLELANMSDKMKAFQRLEQLRGGFPADFDSDKELAEARKEKYGNIG